MLLRVFKILLIALSLGLLVSLIHSCASVPDAAPVMTLCHKSPLSAEYICEDHAGNTLKLEPKDVSKFICTPPEDFAAYISYCKEKP